MSTPENTDGANDDPDGHTAHAVLEHLAWLTEKVTSLQAQLAELRGPTADQHTAGDEPAPWVLYTPPAAADDTAHRPDQHSPLWTIHNFVAWYNTIYTGHDGSTARPIPPCWEHHPALAAEIGTLAHTWRHANIGDNANAQDAQHWHHHWRPGFTERLAQWTHPGCQHGEHPNSVPPARPFRYPPER